MLQIENCKTTLSCFTRSGKCTLVVVNVLQTESGHPGAPLQFFECHCVTFCRPHVCSDWSLFTDRGGKGETSPRRVSGNIPLETETFLVLLMDKVSSSLVSSQNYQHGIFQSIGFKEFHDYLTAPESSTQQEKDALRDKGQRDTQSTSRGRI